VTAPDFPHFDDVSACATVDPEVFFPANGQSAEPAKRVCAPCVNRDACLTWALTWPEGHGVWGGSTEDERRALRRVRGLPQPSRVRSARQTDRADLAERVRRLTADGVSAEVIAEVTGMSVRHVVRVRSMARGAVA
jgi:WhiB family redox-sensing transcriptional regulator